MDLYVLDAGFNKIGFPIENYISCIWRTSFYEIGDCELYISANTKVLSLLISGTYLVRDQDMHNMYYENVMKIESIKIETNEENGDHITVTGKDLKTILNQRVIMNKKISSSTNSRDVTLVNVLTEVFEANFLNPSNPNRKLDVELIFDGTTHNEHIVVEEGIHDNAGEWMIEQCKTYECGIIPSVNTQKSPRAGTIDYLIQKVKDNNNIEFSSEYIDISASAYTHSTENSKNVAIVAGDEVNGVQIVEIANDDISGMDRYETYISSSISSDGYFNNDEIKDSEGTYRDVLKHEGNKALQETKVQETFECDIQSYGQYQLGIDFFLGDKVTVNNKYGIKAQGTIVEIIDTHDETGRTIIPKFSDFKIV